MIYLKKWGQKWGESRGSGILSGEEELIYAAFGLIVGHSLSNRV